MPAIFSFAPLQLAYNQATAVTKKKKITSRFAANAKFSRSRDAPSRAFIIPARTVNAGGSGLDLPASMLMSGIQQAKHRQCVSSL